MYVLSHNVEILPYKYPYAVRIQSFTILGNKNTSYMLVFRLSNDTKSVEKLHILYRVRMDFFSNDMLVLYSIRMVNEHNIPEILTRVMSWKSLSWIEAIHRV